MNRFEINFNMGCIEILCCMHLQLRCFRLTLTWDVLKFVNVNIIDGSAT